MDYKQSDQQAPPMYVSTQPTVIVTPGVVALSDGPMQMICPSCRAQIITRVDYKSGLLAWLICGGLCLFGCWLGCQFIPFCVDACKDVEHQCPNCNAFIGLRKKV